MKPALLLIAALLAGCNPRPEATAPPASVRGDMLSADETQNLAAAYRAAGAAFGRSDFQAVAAAFRGAARLNRGDDSLLYQEAAALALAGRREEALAALERLAAAGSHRVPEARDFPGVEPEGLELVTEKIRAALPPTRSARAFTLPERDLIAEGVTLDATDRVFFVGSIHRRKVIAVAADGSMRDLVASAADDLYSPLGMRHDPRRGSLWVASAATDSMQGYDPALHRGRSALHEYDAVTGRLRARYPRDPQRPHLLNDLVVTSRGELFITDSETGEVLLLAPAPGADFSVVVPPGELFYPNGIALSADESTLFVADFVNGLSAIRLADRKRTTLPHPRGASTRGIDGLYFHRGALIGVDNGAGAGRIVRFELAPAQGRILGVTVLESGHPSFEIPTTGTLDGDDLVYIANSQLRSFEDGQIFPPDRLFPTELLRLPLTGR